MKPRSQGPLSQLGAARSRATGRMPALAPSPPPAPENGAIRRWMRGALVDNIGLKFLSIVLAVTVFLLVNTDKDREIRVRAGVKYEYPADKVLTSEPLDEVTVTIKGAWRRLRQFDERELNRVTLDFSKAPSGEVSLTPDMFNLPPGLTVTSISPRTIRVSFDRRVEKLVEVAPVTAGRPQHGYVMAEQKVVPPTVKVRGGERLLAALSAIRTQEVSLEGRTDSFDAPAELAPPTGVEIDPGQRVHVHVRIDEELVTRKLPGLIVELRGDGIEPAKWALSPKQVEVTLTGALLAVEKAKDAMVPVVRLKPGDREAEVLLEGLPPGVGSRISPERVKVGPAR
ncbi:MAG: CdaR family protein [Kofleriaceae bacterium]